VFILFYLSVFLCVVNSHCYIITFREKCLNVIGIKVKLILVYFIERYNLEKKVVNCVKCIEKPKIITVK